ncbi:MAG: hypothetical protein K9K32_07465 [Halanaerobiales bacterium]|nr:hypothetical protein [Halanaerobiales bacterium]
MSEYTEKPWGYEESQTVGDNYLAFIVSIEKNQTKELGRLGDFEVSRSETKANAKLIAKSPEMIDMLKKCRDFLNLKSYGTKLTAQINDLLNEIEGDND